LTTSTAANAKKKQEWKMKKLKNDWHLVSKYLDGKSSVDPKLRRKDVGMDSYWRMEKTPLF
jgi:hypothetical protein